MKAIDTKYNDYYKIMMVGGGQGNGLIYTEGKEYIIVWSDWIAALRASRIILTVE